MTAKPSGKTGWTQHEQDILFEQAKKARDLGLPLKAAFDQTARPVSYTHLDFPGYGYHHGILFRR